MEKTKKDIKKIGILTSGGDSPGMNAALRAITRSAISQGIRVIGILKGYRGLIDGELIEFDARHVSNIITKGGTILYSDRCDEFKTDEGMKKAVDTCKEYGIDGIVAIGGDGTFRGGADLSRLGIPTVGIPATIDNDITATDYAIGFDTAMNTVVEMVDRLRDTCESHARCSVVEVMGRDAGYIALECGIAVGAIGIAINEIPFDEDECIKRILEGKKTKKRNNLVLVSEGMGDTYAEYFSNKIQEETGVESRFARLAHVQRGGSPTARDRLIATLMGNRAITLLLDGKKDMVVCMENNEITEFDIEYAFNLDKRYKGKMSDEDFNLLNKTERERIDARVKLRRAKMKEMYEIAKIMSL